MFSATSDTSVVLSFTSNALALLSNKKFMIAGMLVRLRVASPLAGFLLPSVKKVRVTWYFSQFSGNAFLLFHSKKQRLILAFGKTWQFCESFCDCLGGVIKEE